MYVGNEALRSGKQFHSTEAVQAHMRDKGQCSLELEGNEEELGAFYDLASLAEESPLWNLDDDDDEGWEDCESDEGEGEAAGEAAAARIEALCAAAAAEEGGDEGEGPFEQLFDEAVSLGVLTEAQLDAITDAIAGGETTAAAAVSEWRDRVATAAAAAASAAARPARAAPSTTTAASAGARYAPLPSSAGAASLNVSRPDGTTREVGHRDFAPFYKQRHHEGGGALALHGGFGPNHAPGSLRALMLQYRAAGVLATAAPPPRAGKGARSEMNKASLHRQARDHVRLGITNNSMAPGMKHYKNQSLQF